MTGTTTQTLTGGHFYHIYNHAVGGRDLFREPANYGHFLKLYEKYISPVAETYAWVLMPNHFHLLVRIKESVVYKYNKTDFLKDLSNSDSNNDFSYSDRSIDAVRMKKIQLFNEIKWQTINLTSSPNLSAPAGSDRLASNLPTDEKNIIPKPHLHFSHMCNAYSRYFNKRYNTWGTLFERPFRRKLIDNEDYLKNTLLYIHNNPVHHGFCSHPVEYPWSSYLSFTGLKPETKNNNEIIGWFEDEANFKFMHNSKINITEIDNWLEIH